MIGGISTHVVTEISPVFGLALMVLLEQIWFTIWVVGAIAPAIVAVVIGGTFVWQRSKQNKIESARLGMELLAVLRGDDFRDCHVRIRDGKSFAESEEWKTWRIRYLGHFDTICGFHYNDKILTKTHMNELFDAMIQDLWEHDETRQYVYDKERESRYKPLKKWFEEEVKHRLP